MWATVKQLDRTEAVIQKRPVLLLTPLRKLIAKPLGLLVALRMRRTQLHNAFLGIRGTFFSFPMDENMCTVHCTVGAPRTSM